MREIPAGSPPVLVAEYLRQARQQEYIGKISMGGRLIAERSMQDGCVFTYISHSARTNYLVQLPWGGL